MIDEARRALVGPLVSFSGKTDTLQGLSIADLRRIKMEVDALLPERSLSSMNLESELIYQFDAVKELQSLVLTDDETPANQKAQVANSVVATLESLIKMQERYHTAERFKAIENLVIEYMKKLPKDVAEAFLDEYERLEEQ